MGKLTDIQKIEVVEKYLTGKYNCASLAREYGVRQCSMYELLNITIEVELNGN